MKLDFSLQEYQNRFACVREHLARRGLDALLVTSEPDVNYFSGFRSFAPWWTATRPYVLLLPLQRDPLLLVQDFHHEDARRDSWIKDVRGYSSLTGVPNALLVDLFKELGLEGKRVGAELGYEQRLGMPYNDFVTLKESLDSTRFEDASDVIWKTRMIKSEAEIEAHRKACAIGDRVFEVCYAQAKEGMTEKDIARIAYCTVAEEGGEVGFHIICSGPGNYGRVAGMPTGRVLQKGDMVWFDLGIIYNGYWCDFCRAAVVGGPTAEQVRLQKAVVDITRATVEAVRPGMKASELARVCGKAAAGLGIEFSFEAGRLGHGLGIMSTEPPHIAAYDNTVLEPGMVFTIEPGIVNEIGAFIAEENLVLRENGPELLTFTSRELRTI